MFFAASARLAESTADVGDLAARLDEFLATANESWLLDPDEVASALGVDADRVSYLLQTATHSEIGLLREERYLRCRHCGNLMPPELIRESLEEEETADCSLCGEAFTGNEDDVTAYRLTDAAAAESRQRHARPQRTAVVLTALDLELAAVHERLRDLVRDVHSAGTVYHVGNFDTETAVWTVATVAVGAGNSNAAFEAERAIRHFEPELALFVGVAGGLKDVELGDVVAATKVYWYHAGKAGSSFQSRPEVGLSAYALVSQARAARREGRWRDRISATPARPPDLFVEPIAAGEQVVASTRAPIFEFLRAQYGDAVAVEMEGAGFLRAAYGNQRVQAIVVRGISDRLEDKEAADQAGWQPVAADHAAAVAFQLLSSLA